MKEIRCKYCGEQITFSMNSNKKYVPVHTSDPFKKCRPAKVKVYTKEEIRKMNEKLRSEVK